MSSFTFPITFGNLAAGSQPLSDFDQNFTSTGNMGTLACSATGTNTVTLSSLSNYPTLTALGNYQKVAFLASNTTTSLTTIGYGSLGQLNAYSSNGVTRIGSGDLASGVYYEFIYNSALNSGAGGWQRTTTPPVVTSTTVYSQIAGCLPTAISGSSTTAAVTISSGQATDSTNAVYISCAGYSWAVSNGNAINGYAGGTTLPSSSTIHFFVCTGGSGTGSFASTSLAPTFPSGYNTYSRRIFSIQTDSSGNPLGGTPLEVEGGAMLFWLATQVADVNVSNLGTTQVAYTLSVPSGIKVEPIVRALMPTSTSAIIFTSGDETNVAPSPYTTYSAAPGFDNAANDAFVQTTYGGLLTTNTSGQINARSSTASTSLLVVTRGWKDFRRS